MQYFGGKARISKDISDIINRKLEIGQPFVDAFCGSCNVISKITNGRIRIANDKHKYLIAMLNGLRYGWTPPDNVSEEEYYRIKSNPDEAPFLTGFVGFACSFSGKWWGGYARNKRGDNFSLQSKRSLLKKFDGLKDVCFENRDYRELVVPNGAIVYCDIPYKNSTQYCKEIGIFNHEDFYGWVRDNKENFTVYVSEYKNNIPNDFDVVWEAESHKEIRNKYNVRESTIEVLANYTV